MPSMLRGTFAAAALVALLAAASSPSTTAFVSPRPSMVSRPPARLSSSSARPMSSDGKWEEEVPEENAGDADYDPAAAAAAAAAEAPQGGTDYAEGAASVAPPSPAAATPRVEERRLDPLVASLTRMDENTASAPSVRAPLLGEIPLDGSLVVLAPAALIAVLGFVMSINIALNAQDAIVAQVQQTTDVMSAPPVMKVSTPKEGECRGLCSAQDQDLEGLRNVMGRFARDK